MTDRSTRREFLARSALLAAGVSTLALIRPAPSFSRSSVAEELVRRRGVVPSRRWSRGDARFSV